MKINLWFGAAIAAATLSLGASAQAPAGAPAGSNGLCKDGSYSTAAKKDGACRGHKGVQTWYTATAAPARTTVASSSAPAPAPSPASPRPAPATVPRATPAPTPASAPATSSPASARSATPVSRKTSATQTAAAPGGGPGMVWVNTASKVYHCSGTAYYGKTKAGKYVTEDAAKAEGDRADAGKPCSK